MKKFNKYIFLFLYGSKCPILKIDCFNAHIHYAHICFLYQLPLSNNILNFQSINNSQDILNTMCSTLCCALSSSLSLFPCLPELTQMLNVGVIFYNIAQGSKAQVASRRIQLDLNPFLLVPQVQGFCIYSPLPPLTASFQ